MNEYTGQYLCLYARICDPTECKLSALRGIRDYEKFAKNVVPLMLNAFSSAISERHFRNALQYICDIQVEYCNELRSFGVAPASGWCDPESCEPSIRLLKRNHNALCAMDGLGNSIEDLDALLDACAAGVYSSELDFCLLRDCLYVLSQSRKIWHLFQNGMAKEIAAFSKGQEGVSYLTLSTRLSFGELMALNSHFAKMLVFLYTGDKANTAKDFHSCLRHSKRAILDYHKAVLATSVEAQRKKLAPIHINTELVLKICKARYEEFLYSPDEYTKVSCYVGLVHEILDTFGIEECVDLPNSLLSSTKEAS